MRKHLPKYSVYQYKKEVDDKDVDCDFDNEDSISSIVPRGWSQEACRKATIKMIILDELSFNFVENKGFRYFVV